MKLQVEIEFINYRNALIRESEEVTKDTKRG